MVIYMYVGNKPVSFSIAVHAENQTFAVRIINFFFYVYYCMIIKSYFCHMKFDFIHLQLLCIINEICTQSFISEDLKCYTCTMCYSGVTGYFEEIWLNKFLLNGTFHLFLFFCNACIKSEWRHNACVHRGVCATVTEVFRSFSDCSRLVLQVLNK